MDDKYQNLNIVKYSNFKTTTKEKNMENDKNNRFFYNYSIKNPNINEVDKNCVDPSNILERFVKLKHKIKNSKSDSKSKSKDSIRNLRNNINNKNRLNYEVYNKSKENNEESQNDDFSDSSMSCNSNKINIINKNNILDEVSNLSEQMYVMKQIINTQLIRSDLLKNDKINNTKKINKSFEKVEKIERYKSCNKCQNLKNKYSKMKGIIRELKQKIKQFELDFTNIYNSTLNLPIDDSNDIEKRHNDKLDCIIYSLNSFQKYYEKICTINMQINHENECLKDEIRSIIELNEKEQVEINLIYNENSELKNNLKLMNSSISTKINEINDLSSYIEELHEKNNMYKIENEKMNEKIEELRNENNRMKNSFEKFENIRTHENEEKNKLKFKINTLTTSITKLEEDNRKFFKLKSTLKDKILSIASLLYEKRRDLNGTYEVIKEQNSSKILDMIKTSLIILLKQYSKQEVIIEKTNNEIQILKFNFIKCKEMSCIEKLNMSSDIKDLSSIESLLVKSLELKVISLIKDKSFLENLVQTFVSIINNSKIVQLIQDMITTHNITTDLETKKRDILAKLSYEECIEDVNNNQTLIKGKSSNFSELVLIQKQLMEVNDKILNFNGIMKKLQENLINTEIISDYNMINLHDCEQKLIELYNELSIAKKDLKNNKLNFLNRKNTVKPFQNTLLNIEQSELKENQNSEHHKNLVLQKRSNSSNGLKSNNKKDDNLYKKRRIKSTKHYITPRFSVKNSEHGDENENDNENEELSNIKKESYNNNKNKYRFKEKKEIKKEDYDENENKVRENLSSYSIIEDAMNNVNYPLSFRDKI